MYVVLFCRGMDVAGLAGESGRVDEQASQLGIRPRASHRQHATKKGRRSHYEVVATEKKKKLRKSEAG